MNNRTVIIVACMVLFVLVGVSLAVYAKQRYDQHLQEVDSFEECVAEGNPVMESYPAQCISRSGRHFTQPLNEEDQRRLLPPSVLN